MTARFQPGDRVRVRAAWPPTPPTHIRTPHYVRGACGVVERVCGRFGNPEELAFGRRYGAKSTLYRVRFIQSELWADYRGSPADRIDIEIYEFWLEPANEEQAA